MKYLISLRQWPDAFVTVWVVTVDKLCSYLLTYLPTYLLTYVEWKAETNQLRTAFVNQPEHFTSFSQSTQFWSANFLPLTVVEPYARTHVARYKLYPLVFTCHCRHVSCIGDKIVASLSPVCCWIQRDTSRPWHKWIVIMSPIYSVQVSRTSYVYPLTCIRRNNVSGYNLLVRDTGGSGRHVSWWKRSINLLRISFREQSSPLSTHLWCLSPVYRLRMSEYTSRAHVLWAKT